MRTILCPLVIFLLFFLPWRLNSHLTQSTTINNYENFTVQPTLKGTADEPSGQKQYTDRSGMENVSTSSSNEKQHLTSTSHSEQQSIRVKTSSGEGETLNKTTKRNIDDSQNNLSITTEPGKQIVSKEVLTPQKELLNPTESSPRPQDISTVQIQNTTEFVQEVPKNQKADNLPQEKTTRLPSTSTEEETQEITQVNTSASNYDSPVLYVPQINGTDDKTTNTNYLHTVQLPMDTTVQPSSMTHEHTSAVITATDFNKIITGLSTDGVKSTQGPEITKEWKDGDTHGPELQTRSTVQPTVKTSTTTPPYTTKKNTIKLATKPPSKASPNDKHQNNPGAAVAAMIGTTFILMFIAILVILVHKHKIQKRQLENPEWAGPSPFLDGEIQPNLPEMDVSDRHLSQHLTLRRNINEDVFMGDILQGSTFARQSLNELQELNGKPVVKSPTKIEENENQPGSSFMVSQDTKPPIEENPAVTVDIQEFTEQTDDMSPSPSFGTDSVIKPIPTLVSIDLDSLSEEPAPLQTTDVGFVPPAPPLP